MQKIEFGDLNKFLVSCGLVFVGLSFLVPYLFLREDFGLYLSLEEINTFHLATKDFISTKQKAVEAIIIVLPWASLSLFVIGVFSIVYGLKKWFKFDKKIEEEFDQKIKINDLNIHKLSDYEVQKKAEKEIKKSAITSQPKFQDTQISLRTATSKYLEVEKRIEDALEKNSPMFTAFPNVRLDHRFEIDLLVRSLKDKEPDYIIEVKYGAKGFLRMSIREIVGKLFVTLSHYRNKLNFNTKAVILFVHDSDDATLQVVKSFKKDSDKYIEDAGLQDDIVLHIVPEDALEELTIDNIR